MLYRCLSLAGDTSFCSPVYSVTSFGVIIIIQGRKASCSSVFFFIFDGLLMFENSRPTAFITGASSGIGREFALALAKRPDLSLYLVARRRQRLEDLKAEIESIWRSSGEERHRQVEIDIADLSRYEERKAVLSRVTDLGFQVTLLINNAGFGSVSRFSDSVLERQLEMVKVNCEASLHFCHHFIPLMVEHGRGTIINVCSTAAYQPMPYMSTYGSTKSFLLSLSIALAVELRGTGVHMTACCPGPTESEFHLAAGLDDKLPCLPSARAETVVEETLRAADRKKLVYVAGRLNHAIALLARVAPARFSARLVEKALRGRI